MNLCLFIWFCFECANNGYFDRVFFCVRECVFLFGTLAALFLERALRVGSFRAHRVTGVWITGSGFFFIARLSRRCFCF